MRGWWEKTGALQWNIVKGLVVICVLNTELLAFKYHILWKQNAKHRNQRCDGNKFHSYLSICVEEQHEIDGYLKRSCLAHYKNSISNFILLCDFGLFSIHVIVVDGVCSTCTNT